MLEILTILLAPPWGTLNSGGNYSTFYERNQFLEMAVNLSAFGIDPSDIPDVDICAIPFENVMFKSRPSSSFTAQLKDFNGPYPLDGLSDIPASIIGATITCAIPEPTLSADSLLPNAIYTWSTLDGNITSNPVATSITVDATGTYYLAAQASSECIAAYDTIVVTIDTIPPSAAITFDTVQGFDDLTTRLFGWEAGMAYSWSGPNSFFSTNQIVDVTDEGLYILEITSPTNGCIDRDSIYVIHNPCQSSYPTTVDLTEVIDVTPPDFTVPNHLVIDCSQDPTDLTITGDVTDENDNCDVTIADAVFSDSTVLNFPCTGRSIIYRTWSLTDACGNERVQQQIIYFAR